MKDDVYYLVYLKNGDYWFPLTRGGRKEILGNPVRFYRNNGNTDMRGVLQEAAIEGYVDFKDGEVVYVQCVLGSERPMGLRRFVVNAGSINFVQEN